MEWRLYPEAVPHVSTAAFHADRERAPHLEQPAHRERLLLAAEFVHTVAAEIAGEESLGVSDLGCGDGGLLSLVQEIPQVRAWGYDFCPANQAGWTERGVTAYALDVFGEDWPEVAVGDIVVMTETLEHLADPHGVLRRLRGRARWLVCSSPWNENQRTHSPEHAWAWDLPGYAALLEDAGWSIDRHQQAGLFQVVLAH